MHKKQRVQVEMLIRSGAFKASEAEKFPEGSAGQRAFAVIDAAVAEAEAASKKVASIREGGRSLKSATKEALLHRITLIVRTARAIAEETPGADSRFQPPPSLADVTVLTSARAFLDDLVPVKSAFVQHGLPDTFIEDLQRATDAFAQANMGRSAHKSTRRDAQADLTRALRRGLKAARLLDVIIVNTFGAGSPAAEKWKRERYVEAFTKASPTAASEPETTPSADGESPLRRAS